MSEEAKEKILEEPRVSQQEVGGGDTEKLSGAELVNPYREGEHKAVQVEEMFDSIAPAYDFMNTAMSFGLHRHWRNKALSAASAVMARLQDRDRGYGAGLSILDIATGTGDVAFELHRRFPYARILGVDLSAGMLKIAGEKLEKADESAKKHISFEQGDSLDLKLADASFDLITVAYGVRNFEHLLQGLREMRRVLKPDGLLCVIELSEPEGNMTRAGYRLYSRYLIPTMGQIVSGDSRAYRYLPESIAAAPQRDKMVDLMIEAGFGKAAWRSLTFGAVTYYLAVPVARSID